MKKKYIIPIILFLIIVCVTGWGRSYSSESKAGILSNELTMKNKEVKKQTDEISSNLEKLQDKYYEEKLKKLLNKEQLTSIAKEQWSYSLTVNDDSFKNGTVTASSRNVVIVLKENQNPERILPINILNTGSLTSTDSKDKFYEHIKIDSSISYTKSIKVEKNSTNAIFSFKNIPNATIITLTVSEPLREKLKLEYNKLEIVVK
jgi:hypothetical protein